MERQAKTRPHVYHGFGERVDQRIVVIGRRRDAHHLVFFLHITTGADNTNNVLALAFGFLVVFLVIAGSVWIMTNLNENLMPPAELMNMNMRH